VSTRSGACVLSALVRRSMGKSSRHQTDDLWRARSYAPQFIFTTTLPPMVAAGACAAIRHLKALNEERTGHQYMAVVTKHAQSAAGPPILDNPSHIVPVMIGDADRYKAATSC
jgi:7-keto-8-aminopelargonate synthetase-like enzyme